MPRGSRRVAGAPRCQPRAVLSGPSGAPDQRMAPTLSAQAPTLPAETTFGGDGFDEYLPTKPFKHPVFSMLWETKASLFGIILESA